MTTQRYERVGSIAKKLTDWVEAIDNRLNDCDRELTEKITSLEHRLKTLSIQLDIQKDRQGETPDMEPLINKALDHLDVQRLIDAIESQIEESTEIDEADYESVTSPLPNQETVETADAVETDSIDERERTRSNPSRVTLFQLNQ
ncbi:hypothetical protein EZJ55_00410 [Microcystis aeruginosa EAWAG127a]|uniref:Uncharacterized protein n=1 Tax=Microcystis aeruginosa EAWAG127a TaxID=2529855 RepID=A0A5J5M1T8_MICAE|nr:hypothetical protein [Microcystis aeruginosa]KAB0244039.1 hypothetical protein EZJ55_00410 [Microcystis aeruginosa EAWAG127a]